MTEISVQEFKRWLDEEKTHTLLDVRFQEEKSIADIGGLLIPLPELERRHREIPKDNGPVVVYCHHGVRSTYAAQHLERHGFEVLNLTGGIDAWSRQIDPRVPLY